MTEIDLSALDALYADIPTAVWAADGTYIRDDEAPYPNSVAATTHAGGTYGHRCANARFIAAIHNAYPALAARIRELEAALAASQAREAALREELRTRPRIISYTVRPPLDLSDEEDSLTAQPAPVAPEGFMDGVREDCDPNATASPPSMPTTEVRE